MKLSEDFIEEIKRVLGSDFEKYISVFNQPPYRGISINRLKITPEKLSALLPFEITKSPFYSEGFYIPSDTENIGTMPLHCAGAFYVQEPSASSAAGLLDIKGGETVLDLCAAPGGKSAQISSMLRGKGIIWSNEIVKSRAKILLSNFERMGISNGIVSSCHPDLLCERLSGFFDRVLVDAPCSGEGMFRKNNDAIQEWSREHVLSCAERQVSILKSAAKAVKQGGILVYSTCTFSYEENEGVVKRFLEICPEFEPYDINEDFGRKTELSNAVRITPIEGGEGHFAARFRRKGENEFSAEIYQPQKIKKSKNNIDEQLFEEMLNDIFINPPEGIRLIKNDKAYILPKGLPDFEGLGVIRAGILAGTIKKSGKKSRIEPEHALFMAAKPENIKRLLDMKISDKRINEFLSGNEIECDGEKGYTAVSVEGVIIGYGKCSDGRLKNKYPTGLRINF